MRLQKFLSQNGVCSRRKAEELILEGRVTINDGCAKIGDSVSENDVVKVDGCRVKSLNKKRLVIMMNKPRGVVCSSADRFHPGATIFDLLPKEHAGEKLMYCGRLDKDSQGMLILTNDGNFANKLTHPRSNISKIYIVTLRTRFDPKNIPLMLNGIIDDGETLIAEKIVPIGVDGSGHSSVEVHLKQGKKREIRRMFAACGYLVHRLKRVQIGKLKLKNLRPGQLKLLNEPEICRLLGRDPL
ncbi:MAG: rRNA pseudouridine synthase [Puniceicoccales bacterium]|jgi:23S rRNA pseudouridine2605 synthase|nr:rRNA pseudouridine synthase [Puniceicoccales bacterium]